MTSVCVQYGRRLEEQQVRDALFANPLCWDLISSFSSPFTDTIHDLFSVKMQANSRPTSSRPAASPAPKSAYQVNTQTKVLDTHHGRLLCIADIRGKLSSLNDLAREADAKAIIHTGDFGFFGTWQSSLPSHTCCLTAEYDTLCFIQRPPVWTASTTVPFVT
jgi:hypothetical protein